MIPSNRETSITRT
uniref:Uncharacterized protein n=1 Tax=Lepeophtheirus salmonis TaxID=72036 RepID=A0A0K2SZ34_LEPSM